MQFTLTVRYPDGTGGREQHDLLGMRSELASLANVLDAMVPGEQITITRLRDVATFAPGSPCGKCPGNRHDGFTQHRA